MKNLITAITCIAALIGCAMTPEQRVEHMTRTYGSACLKLGYTVDSDSHRNCLMKMADFQQAEDAKAYAAIAAANSTFQSVYRAGQIK
jgi:hypothetical protein